jgi:hypothetical protein
MTSESNPLDDALKENAFTKSASTIDDWTQMESDTPPIPLGLVDCSGSDPDSGNSCFLKPYWVIEAGVCTTGRPRGLVFACLPHVGKVVNAIMAKDPDADTQTLVFYQYKGK